VINRTDQIRDDAPVQLVPRSCDSLEKQRWRVLAFPTDICFLKSRKALFLVSITHLPMRG
jgi:hypothetical protein